MESGSETIIRDGVQSPKRHIGVVMMMQVLPFYDEGAIRTLRDFEELVYQKVR
jgi:hypothetical protein